MIVGSSNESQKLSDKASKSENDVAVLTVRNLVADLCNQHGSGHGGSAIGMAAIGVALWKYAMRYNPNDPAWFDRDRFVLSNGTSPCLYQQGHDLTIARTCQYLPLCHEPPCGILCLDNG